MSTLENPEGEIPMSIQHDKPETSSIFTPGNAVAAPKTMTVFKTG